MEFTKKNIRTIILLILFTALTFKFVQEPGLIVRVVRVITSLLFPFLIGVLAAMILNIPMRFFERLFIGGNKKKRSVPLRAIALIFTFLTVGGLIFLISLFMIPKAWESLEEISKDLPTYIEKIKIFLEHHNLPSDFLPNITSNGVSDIIQFIQSFWTGSSSNLASTLIPFITSFFGNIINFFLGLVFSIYILMQKERILYFASNSLHAFLPEKFYRKCVDIAKHSGYTFSNFLSGQCLDALILSVMMLVAMLIFGIPFAPLIALLIFVCALIPIFGAWISAGIAVVLIFTQSWVDALIFAIMYIIIQQIDNNFIYPKIVGKSVGLPGILVLLAVSFGTNAFGLIGAIFSVPICAVLYALFKELVVFLLNKKGVKNVNLSTESIFHTQANEDTSSSEELPLPSESQNETIE